MHDDNEFTHICAKLVIDTPLEIDKSSDRRSRTAPASALDRSYDEETMMNKGHHRHFFQGDANVEKRTTIISDEMRRNERIYRYVPYQRRCICTERSFQ
ncbi:hypothetical protein KIN20_010266 [Parelaphostrongylus tenuis]|uniref:Uncharacterized protein n=1 Tax=Parelaphostrongylus tenuis TaxID=148309 RepID=A0AAD5QP03_PARTN|nr:hypothetical protein KIN20_010266 [Parelaphostrongylus tenuis]